ncbi:MAG: bifunctional folylpolyglutamate synthase/dihydrofolate synthase [Chloroflexi bacterium AL-W]|nr:bifunctional folylpolyglutamate synthase/dihydrofolate synthase [Chloroflexi bacterium AL-N1]NOK68920.1 bifunctional folylpolyglutamate synthase/dihydrofolate synthase [Chloroflexi bacterium AL-N10]NOK76903.1 bifunctional folylpolyglutamate synthase/dihydrofolate synthase [Chloroflexi bacterium AL-N5]NOK82709.1 bifunctional folylpolyglutamate synthase/dihydrofolate synthase [Chloroflexi bacterium AL-W]NOK90760.1 bifunctional folylpolyglutamate synthase/dihydrofolate synthase [Chloroflexi bac
MKYQEALNYLYSFVDSERKLPRLPEFNLPRTTALLEAFGNPHHALNSVVIAGTKGKGSTAAILESIIRTAGYRTGLWTSPHLHSYRERIQIDRQLISQRDLSTCVAEAQKIVRNLDPTVTQGLTTFEIGFAIALYYFAHQQVDLAILEVGLGGRYDSANAVTPILSIITAISYDHMHVLGNTLAEIAYDKAGIIKPGVQAITIPQPPEAMEQLVRAATESETALWVADEEHKRKTRWFKRQTEPDDSQYPLVRFNPLDHYHNDIYASMKGVFQRENTSLAIGAAQLLRARGFLTNDQTIKQGLATVHWHGRMEILDTNPTYVLDGAHNGASAQSLMHSLDQLFPDQRRILVFGTTQDKDLARMLPALIPAVDAIVLTRSHHPRALTDLNKLAMQIQPWLRQKTHHTPIVLKNDLSEALTEAQKMAESDDIICVTGSLFVVAAAREALGLDHEQD